MELNGHLHSPAAFTPKKIPPSKHWIGDRVDPRVSLDIVEKRKNILLLPGKVTQPSRL
jgi:hypothetical protein